MERILHCLLALLLGITGSGIVRAQSAQRAPLDPDKALTQYVHTVWNDDDGLPHSTVNAVAQTPDGYLWLGTDGGVVRFDGVAFDVYNRSNTEAFAEGHSVRALTVDGRGRLWIGTAGAGLIRYDGGAFVRITSEPGLTSAQVQTLHLGADGTLWIGTVDEGLFRMHEGRLTRYASALVGNMVMALHADRRGALWVGTNEGLYRMHGDSVRAYGPDDGLPGSWVVALGEDAAGRLWVSTRQGIARLSEGVVQHAALPGDLAQITAFAFWTDATGNLWLGTDGRGLVRVRGDSTQALTTEEGLLNNRVVALYQDREGSLWFGTEGGGLNQLRDGKFAMFGTPEGLGADMVLTVYEDADGPLWIGTEGGGVSRLRGNRMTTLTTADGLSSNVVLSVNEDASGALWIGTYGGGVNRLEDGQITTYSTQNGFLSDAVFALHRGRSGALWMGTDAGVVRYADDDFTFLTEADGLSSNLISTLHEDVRGSLWIGTFPNGLDRFRDGQFTHFDRADGLPEAVITDVHQDADGTLWLGTRGGGLVRYRAGEFTAFTSRDGLHSDNIYQILEDERGRLWLGSAKGIFRLSRRALNAYAEGRSARLHPVVFGESDGLRTDEMNGGVQPAGWKRHDGTLWFPTAQGVASIDPADIRRNDVPPPVMIEFIMVDGVPVEPGASIELAPGTKKVSVQFAAPTFVAPASVRYRYRLDGYDEAWSTWRAERVATYTNLDPGTYTFRVQAQNADGVLSEQAAAQSFAQRPFFYEMPFFWVVCVIGVLGMGATAYRIRLGRLKARQEELEALVDSRTHELRELNDHLEDKVEDQLQTILRERETYEAKLRQEKERAEEAARLKSAILNNMSHEFRTPMTGILGYSEILLDEVDETYREFASTIHDSGQRLMSTLDAVLDLARLEASATEPQKTSIDVAEHVKSAIRLLERRAVEQELAFHCTLPPEPLTAELDPSALERVVHILVDNAIKFTPQGAVWVAVEEADGTVVVRVRDTGIGIGDDFRPYLFEPFRQESMGDDRDFEGNGLNLSIAKRLVDLSDGTIHVESEKGVGSTFTVRLPRFERETADATPPRSVRRGASATQ